MARVRDARGYLDDDWADRLLNTVINGQSDSSTQTESLSVSIQVGTDDLALEQREATKRSISVQTRRKRNCRSRGTQTQLPKRRPYVELSEVSRRLLI